MRYDDKVVDEVLAASDIVEIISQYIPLKRSGRNFKACCPFHQEKTASFMVSSEKQIFHCFGCQAGGNVFSFLMRHENVSFPEALRQLAERAHIRLPETTRPQGQEAANETERLYEIYRLAADYYHGQFSHPEIGRAARDYFKLRGFEEKVASDFKVGWAPAGWRNLFEYLSKKGFSETLLLRSGLIHRASQGQPYDVFRNRLLFPIQNLQGKVVAFGGRLIDKSEGPKYLNSPENPIFHKRRELFGLNLAKKFIDPNLRQICIVEGYLDFLRLYDQGFKTTVATLGTALTDDHVRVLKRFADEAVVVYDGDAAGEAASLRGLEIFLEGGMSVKVVRMPQGFDPDDFLKKESAPAFRKLLDEARDFFDYQLEILLGRYNRKDSLGLMKITSEFLETLTKVKNPILLDLYLKRLAESLGVHESSLRNELVKLNKKVAKEPGEIAEKASRPLPSNQASEDEILLLALMIENEELRETILQETTPSDFEGAGMQKIYDFLSALPAGSTGNIWAQILNHIDEEAVKTKLAAISALSWSEENRRKAVRDCLHKIKSKRLEKKSNELRRQITQAEQAKDMEHLSVLLREYQGLLEQSREMPPRQKENPL